MITQTREQWFRPVINFWGEFWQRGQECFWEKLEYSLLLCKFQKEASKKVKNCQSFESFETTKSGKKQKTKKTLVQTLPIKEIFHFYL